MVSTHQGLEILTKGMIVGIDLYITMYNRRVHITSTFVNSPTLLDMSHHNMEGDRSRTDAKLRAIRKDNAHSIKDCCNEMFSEWLWMQVQSI